MKFTPKTEEQVKSGRMLTPGECDFEVRDAKDEISKKGNAMIHLVLDVWDSEGEQAIVHDYLIEAMPHKVRHFCYGVGLGHAYESGDLSAGICIGKGGRCKLTIKEDQQYGPKNNIADYVLAESTKAKPNYQASKSGGPGAAEAVRVRNEAWKSFQKLRADLTGVDLNGAWLKAVRDRFNGKAKDDITADEWNDFVKDGFKPSPIASAGEGTVADDDVPF